MKLAEVLQLMGSTADQVAAFLLRQGVKGRRRSQRHNPLAQFINAYEITWSGVEVSKSMVLFNDCQIIDFSLPFQHCDFRIRFDDGAYPELVDDNAGPWRPKFVPMNLLADAAKELARLHSLNQKFRGWDEAIKQAEQEVLKAACAAKG